MFVLLTLDNYEAVMDTIHCDTIEDAVLTIRQQLNEGTGTDNMELFRKVDFTVTFDIQVKVD